MSIFSTLFGTSKEKSDKIEILNQADFSAAIAGKKVQLIDVRTPNEYGGGHIKNAVNVDFFNAAGFERYCEKMSKDKPVYLYCRSGARSQRAAHKLIGMGFEKVYDLRGGYMSWR
ncbi:rhodanese-like domain-containing protein [Arenibacter sp. F20364]|uniref:rhodanese-like domain-containing protein n=1 Tax=Arenibacter sp. F20364 TaxID=2926415 RepID=UPI001FF614CD|nr:rhodanese-like domain-containing protein [Arenibacter sp. F20364]MCK0189637.1 rhodanese-like domain-containing protein [Arenibacter sp. F20364]